MNDTFMKEKPVFPLIAGMALPMVLSMLVNSLYNIVDSFFVARISEKAMTALSLVYPVQNLINAAAIGFGVGINAAASFYLGAADKEKAGRAAVHGLVLSAIHGLIITVGSILIMPAFLGMFTSDQEVIQMGLQYSRIAFAFSVIIMLSLSFEKIFQAAGRMKTTMASLLCGCLANIILDPLMIFGIGIFPEMGIRGAALATGLGQVLTVLVYLTACVLFPLPMPMRRRHLAPNGAITRRLYAVGIPAALSLALPSLLISCLNGLLSLYSEMYVVILGIYYKLQTFLYLPASGVVQGMRPVIGYNYGAGEISRVRSIYKTTLVMCAAIMLLGTVICLTASRPLMALFTENEETIKAGGLALRIISAGFLLSSLSVTASGALEGLGMGFASLIISLMRYAAVILPAAWILCRLLGPEGVWHAFWITEAAAAAVSAAVWARALRGLGGA